MPPKKHIDGAAQSKGSEHSRRQGRGRGRNYPGVNLNCNHRPSSSNSYQVHNQRGKASPPEASVNLPYVARNSTVKKEHRNFNPAEWNYTSIPPPPPEPPQSQPDFRYDKKADQFRKMTETDATISEARIHLGALDGRESVRAWATEHSFGMTQQILEATIGNDHLYGLIPVPKRVEKNEWLALSLYSVFTDLQLVVSSFRQVCRCNLMNAGSTVYFYNHEGRDLLLSSREYMHKGMSWMMKQFKDPRIFPRYDYEFPSHFLDVVKRIATLMIRIYAHMYREHIKAMQTYDSLSYVNACFKYFIFVSEYYQLLDEAEKLPIKNICAAYIAQLHSRLSEGLNMR